MEEVLIVDDAAYAREPLGRFLEEVGHVVPPDVVLGAPDGREAATQAVVGKEPHEVSPQA